MAHFMVHISPDDHERGFAISVFVESISLILSTGINIMYVMAFFVYRVF